jgi:hypothetical protein
MHDRLVSSYFNRKSFSVSFAAFFFFTFSNCRNDLASFICQHVPSDAQSTSFLSLRGLGIFLTVCLLNRPSADENTSYWRNDRVQTERAAEVDWKIQKTSQHEKTPTVAHWSRLLVQTRKGFSVNNYTRDTKEDANECSKLSLQLLVSRHFQQCTHL